MVKVKVPQKCTQVQKSFSAELSIYLVTSQCWLGCDDDDVTEEEECQRDLNTQRSCRLREKDPTILDLC